MSWTVRHEHPRRAGMRSPTIDAAGPALVPKTPLTRIELKSGE
jgi:hypothetical protein